MFENEKTNNVEELGNKKLDLNIKYPEVDKGNNIRMLDGTIKEFLKKHIGIILLSLANENILPKWKL